MPKKDDHQNTYAQTAPTGIISEHLTERFTERTFTLFDDTEGLSRLAEKWQNLPRDKAQGFMFEQLETLKFNLDALRKESDLYAKTTESMGLHTAPADIIITRGKQTLREVQAKSCNTAARSAFALSQEKYEKMLRLAPKEQEKEIRRILNARIEAGTLKAADYEKTLQDFSGKLKYENISSSGTSYEESCRTTDPEIARLQAGKIKIQGALADMHNSGKVAGQVGAVMAGGISTFQAIRSLYREEMEFGEAIGKVTIDSAKGFATGYTVTAISKGTTHLASNFLGRSVAASLKRSNAPLAVASGIVQTGKSLLSYMKGDISSEQLLDQVSHTAITSTSVFYYAGLGQVAIPIPIVGSFIGAAVGYCVGNMLHQSGLIALGSSAQVKVAKARRREVEALCLSIIPEMQKNRAAFQKYLDEYFAERKNSFQKCFFVMEKAFDNSEPELFVSALEQINEQFGKTLPFKNFREFDDFMKSDEAFVF